jgi:hypothetical protein
MKSKLLCTFVQKNQIEERIEEIRDDYVVLFSRIFILYGQTTGGYMLTYSVDSSLMNGLPPSSITVHRKKETNTLYTINALNTLIKEVNNGVLDREYQVDWTQYRNNILLTKGPELRVIRTKLYDIVDLGEFE